MKKILISCLFLFTLVVVQGGVQAAAIPTKVGFDVPVSRYDGGNSYPIRILATDDAKPGSKLLYDIGVSRRLVSGRIVQFQIVSSDTVNAADVMLADGKHNLTLPNPLDSTATSTYVIYVKSYYPNDPESEQLVISQPFTINKSDKSFVELVSGAVVLNTGRSHAFTTGPTIYKEAKTIEYATSARLVLNISSNIALTVTPKITFTKLRSNSFSREVIGQPIDIVVGANTKFIDLPTFDYEPGVYKGQLELQSSANAGLIEKINFQYIVDGPFVTIGQLKLSDIANDTYTFNLETFSKPVDTLTPGIGEATSSPDVYKTLFTFLDVEGKTLTTEERNIEYGLETYTLISTNKKIKNAAAVAIKVYDDTGKVFFETVQDLNMPKPTKDTQSGLYALSILLLGIAIYIITRRKWVLILAIILGLASAALYIFAAPWSPSPTSSSFNQYHRVTLTFDRDYSTEYLSCSEPTNMLVKINIRTCDNGTDYVELGTSRISNDDAKNHRQVINYINDPSKTYEKTLNEGGGSYDVFNYSLPFVQIDTFQGPIAANTKVYVYVKVTTELDEDYECPAFGCNKVFDENAKYTITLKATPTTGVGSCDKCSNIVGEQDVPTFTARGRNYFFTADSGGTLFFALSSATAPGVCTLDMCADTDVNEATIPAGFTWKGTGTAYEQRTCIPQTTESCSCSGRNRVCINNGVVTSNAPDASCNLDATCTYPLLSPAGSVVFTYSATNVIGTLIGGGSITRVYSTSTATTVTETRTLSNTGDGQTDTATCSYDYIPGPIGGGGNPTCSPGSIGPCTDPDNPPVNPVVVSFTASKIVDKGRDCVFTWDTTDFDECKLSGQLVGLDGTETFGTSEGKNITKSLTCTLAGSAAYPTKTATCLVRPSFIEQ